VAKNLIMGIFQLNPKLNGSVSYQIKGIEIDLINKKMVLNSFWNKGIFMVPDLKNCLETLVI
jgi:hypothetical protein